MIEYKWMGEALREAELALREGEVPVGAVVVKGGCVIGRGHNQVEGRASVTAHAELLAVGEAAAVLGGWRLDGCTIYVTLEPCHMCFGAFYLARVEAVRFGARQPRSGSCGSVDDFHRAALFNHTIDVSGGIREEECLLLLRNFFEELRAGRGLRRDARAG